jgi:hypothetical protein
MQLRLLISVLVSVLGGSQAAMLVCGEECAAQIPPSSSPFRASASKSVGGVTFEYFNDNGSETLRVTGPLPSDFEKEAVLAEFRRSLGIDTERINDKASEPAKSLFDSFTRFFVQRTEFGSEMDKKWQQYNRVKIQDQIDTAKRELDAVKDDLRKIEMQELILRQRQQELARWLNDELKRVNFTLALSAALTLCAERYAMR